MFVYEPNLISDSVRVDLAGKKAVYLIDSISGLTLEQKRQVFYEANMGLNSSRNTFRYDEESAKEALTQLYKYKIEWHKKLVLPISIMIFFLIGAPIGAIIRKGGLGMPVVASVSFFVIYYVINLAGEKMAREGSWETYRGVWLATFILFPLAIFLTYKASRDSNLFDAEWYSTFFHRIKAIVMNIIPRRDGRTAV
jgi:lipopolysaccharide export system permease protein